MIKVISFDMQGTLTDAAFSDEFWLETLPALYAEKQEISVAEAKEILKKKFNEWGKNDYRYYSIKYWMKELEIHSFKEIFKRIINKPHLYVDSLEILNNLYGKKKMIIISSTTKEFISVELGRNKKYFSQIFSSLDDFNISGKPPKLYTEIAKVLEVKPEEILHIGDKYDMDIEHAKKAGLQTFYLKRKLPRKEVIETLKNILYT